MSGEPETKPAGDTPRLRFEDEIGRGSGKRDIAGLMIALGLFALAVVITNDASGYVIRRSYARFGPEIVPYLIAAGLAVLGALTVVMAWRGKFEARERLNIRGVLWLVGGIVAEIVMLYSGTGFIPGSAVLFACAAFAFGQTTIFLNLAVGGVMSTLLFLLFRYGLGLSLPSGPLERAIDLLLR
jgi:putative tricarboxylic transport membrane protein